MIRHRRHWILEEDVLWLHEVYSGGVYFLGSVFSVTSGSSDQSAQRLYHTIFSEARACRYDSNHNMSMTSSCWLATVLF